MDCITHSLTMYIAIERETVQQADTHLYLSCNFYMHCMELRHGQGAYRHETRMKLIAVILDGEAVREQAMRLFGN